jgi:hypothetical protein
MIAHNTSCMNQPKPRPTDIDERKKSNKSSFMFTQKLVQAAKNHNSLLKQTNQEHCC